MTPVFLAGSAKNAIVENTKIAIGIFTYSCISDINKLFFFNMMKAQLFGIFVIFARKNIRNVLSYSFTGATSPLQTAYCTSSALFFLLNFRSKLER